MQNKLAILIALAKCPDGRATLNQLGDEVAALVADENIQKSEQLSALDHIDIFQAALVVSEDDSLQLTENGWSLLRALGILAQESCDPDLESKPQTLDLIDDLIGIEARLKIFDLEPRSVNQNGDLIPAHDETRGPEASSGTSLLAAARARAGSNNRPAEADRLAVMSNERSVHHSADEILSDAPASSNRRFGSGLRGATPRSNPLSKLTKPMRQGISIWRHHLQKAQPPREIRRSGANIERGLFALLSLLVIVSCAGAVAALMQVRSLKSELTALQRELLPLKERIATLDLIQRSKEVPEKMSEETSKSSRESRAEEAPLLLSGEEIQLIRDYIKPAPVVNSSTTPISVGDTVTGPTIPFPSPITGKVPKLLGARFAIRNGAIVILKRDSRQAAAVLGPN